MTEEQVLVSQDEPSDDQEYQTYPADLHRLAAHHFFAAARHQLRAAEAAEADEVQGAAYEAYLAYGHQIQAVSYAEEAAVKDEEFDEEIDEDELASE